MRDNRSWAGIGQDVEHGWCMTCRILFIALSMSLVFCGTAAKCLAYDVVLNWQANAETDLSGYKIYYSVDGLELPFAGTGLANGPSPVDVSNQTSSTISGLDPERTYHFAVVAYNTEGYESLYSNVVVSLPEVSPPSLTVSSAATKTLLSSQDISGTVFDDFQVDSVRVQVNDGIPAVATINGSIWTANITGLKIGDNSVVVTATDSSGNSTQKSLSITLYHVGPVNNNGSPGISDALTVLQYVVGLKNPTTEELIRSDVSPIDTNTRQPKPNGKLDVSDALAILRKVVGLSW